MKLVHVIRGLSEMRSEQFSASFATSFWSQNQRIAEEVIWFFLSFLPGSPKLPMVYMWICSTPHSVIYPRQASEDLLRTVSLFWHAELPNWGSGSTAACSALLLWSQ